MNAYTRIQWLHEQISAMRYPNAQRLSERFGISHRQAQRDLRYLREELHAPLNYSPERRGFTYAEAFSLPIYIKDIGNKDFTDFLDSLISAEEEKSTLAQNGYLQLQIPFTATIQLTDKLAQMSLARFIVEDKGDNQFLCEFNNIDLFLSALLFLDSEARILSPGWLRDQLLSIARRALRNNE